MCTVTLGGIWPTVSGGLLRLYPRFIAAVSEVRANDRIRPMVSFAVEAGYGAIPSCRVVVALVVSSGTYRAPHYWGAAYLGGVSPTLADRASGGSRTEVLSLYSPAGGLVKVYDLAHDLSHGARAGIIIEINEHITEGRSFL